jgi:hypothetical protein
MPPPAWAGSGLPTKLAMPDAPTFGEAVALLVDLVFGDEVQQAELALRLDAFLADLGPAGLTRAQGRITALAHQKVAALVRHSFADLGRWQTSLRSLANHLEDLEIRAKEAVADEVGITGSELRVPARAEEGDEPDLDHRAGAEADSPAATPAEVEGDQPTPPSARTRRPPSSKKSTRRKG